MATKPAKIRSSNFELLRVVAITGVVIAHLIGWAPAVAELFSSPSKQTWFLSTMSCAGKIGLQTLMMISGYFLVKSSFKWQRIFKVWKITWIYSVILMTLGLALGVAGFTRDKIIPGLFPVMTGEYWYIPTYIIVILISPVINKFLLETPKKKLMKICLTILVAFYGINFILGIFHIRLDFIMEYRVLTYSLMYLVGGLMRLYPPKIEKTKTLVLLALTLVGLGVWRLCMLYLLKFEGANLWVIDDQDVFVFMVALMMFILFMNLKVKNSKLINALGGATFSVYLITENPFVRPLLWKHIDIGTVAGTKMIYLYPFIWSMVVVAGCFVVDIAGKWIIKTIGGALRKH